MRLSLRWFVLMLCACIVIGCEQKGKWFKNNQASAVIQLYGDYRLDLLFQDIKVATTLPPNNSAINLVYFDTTNKNASATKINVSLVGQFDIPTRTSTRQLVGIEGDISLITQSINDSAVLTISNISISANALFGPLDQNDWRAGWGVIKDATQSLRVNNATSRVLKLSCDNTLKSSLEISRNAVTDIKQFVESCLKI